MALRWKKDGTAKCGPIEVQVKRSGEFRMRLADEWPEGDMTPVRVEKWLRKQAASMLKDLEVRRGER